MVLISDTNDTDFEFWDLQVVSQYRREEEREALSVFAGF